MSSDWQCAVIFRRSVVRAPSIICKSSMTGPNGYIALHVATGEESVATAVGINDSMIMEDTTMDVHARGARG